MDEHQKVADDYKEQPGGSNMSLKYFVMWIFIIGFSFPLSCKDLNFKSRITTVWHLHPEQFFWTNTVVGQSKEKKSIIREERNFE